MLRRSFLKSVGITATIIPFISANSLAGFLSSADYKIRMLTKNMGIFSEKGGTILFLINDEGIVIVDAQFPDAAAHLISELKQKTNQPFGLLINTHHHGDHTAGNIAFKGLVKNVLAHKNAALNQQNVAKKNNNEEKQYFPTQTFDSVWCQRFGKETICLRYFGAAHTNGDSFVHFKKTNIVHVGDLVFNRKHPYVDRSAGASISNWIKVLDEGTKAFNKKTKYVCGHAGEGYDVVIDRKDILLFKDYLQNVLNFVNDEIKAGKDLKEILKSTSIPGSQEWKGEGIQRPLTAAFEELTTKQVQL